MIDEAVIRAANEPPAPTLIVPKRWLRLLRRLLGLPSGRYVIVLTVDQGHCEWSIAEAGRIEH